MRQKGFAPIFIIVILLVVGILYLLISPVIKKTMSLKTLKNRVSPEIYSLIEKGFVDENSVEQIISLQKSYTYDSTHGPCDPEIYNCDTPSPIPTKEEKESKYYKYGFIYSEYFFESEKDYQDELIQLLKTDKYHYNNYLPECSHPEELSVFFISKNQNKIIGLGLSSENGKQSLDIVQIGSKEDITGRSCY